VALEPADRVHFYTDGVTEGRNLVGEPLGEAHLADLVIRETLAGQPAADLAVVPTGAGQVQVQALHLVNPDRYVGELAWLTRAPSHELPRTRPRPGGA
jgi:hypothetical protein